MNIITRTCRPCLLLTCLLLSTACSTDSDTASKNRSAPQEHFAQEQLNALNKAEAVNQLVQDTADRQRREIDTQGR